MQSGLVWRGGPASGLQKAPNGEEITEPFHKEFAAAERKMGEARRGV
jgi:hypothetical protein